MTTSGHDTPRLPHRADGLLAKVRLGALAVAGAGMGGLGLALSAEPARGFSSLLTSSFFFLSLALGGTVFLALMYVANAGWATVLKRVPEAFSTFLPAGALGMLAVLAGLPALYLWARPEGAHDPLVHAKAAFLNPGFFAARMVAVLAIWVFFAWRLRRNSLLQDGSHEAGLTGRNVALSAGFLCVAALTFCLASFDWLMSLEPHWFSTIYGLYNLAGMLEATVAALVLACVLLSRAGLLPNFNDSHLHDLSKLLFGFATFWAYLWFSQYLLIWYANLPEETVYFAARTHHGWAPWFYGNLVLGWAVPFLLLLPRAAKRSPRWAAGVAGLVLVARWLDIHLMVAPANFEAPVGPGLPELAGMVALGGLFVAFVSHRFARAPLLPVGDPYLVESLHHHV